MQGGADAIRAFTEVEVCGQWTAHDSDMWHAALRIPTAAGERPAASDSEAPAPKYRPIAQTDSLVKIIESAVLEQNIRGARKQLEPHQRGVTTPDGGRPGG